MQVPYIGVCMCMHVCVCPCMCVCVCVWGGGDIKVLIIHWLNSTSLNNKGYITCKKFLSKILTN